MRRSTIHELLDELHDTCEIVVRHWRPGCELHDAWRAAQDEALDAYAAWAASPGRTAYAVYVAAADRADAAADAYAAAVRPLSAAPAG
ncbi:hypothetical protein GKE82_22765 [Conexibacter sp. W3-3-2]|uniref:Uncharacterized protein n=1 Tax=Paraconexibacter algicola TaxID=2133960 RepID=A0A2T4UF47_9ACTN|nr:MULTISPECIES: hypothetical protein [Solirubrobacterales]MTD47031.1 hypothetical protein [Conexibacter sp. W3-3-2]PTL56399.1 hypothetical protein C7Y72_15665 [Paraconexibacter algicola]